MAESELNVVTGAFSFTSKYIARRLLADGKRVRTLTNTRTGAISPPPRLKLAPSTSTSRTPSPKACAGRHHRL